MNLLDIIRIGRAKKNLSQKELAKRLGVVPSAVSQWESGKKTPSGDIMIKLILELDLVDELFPRPLDESTAPVSREQIRQQQDKVEKGLVEMGKALPTAPLPTILEFQKLAAVYAVLKERFDLMEEVIARIESRLK